MGEPDAGGHDAGVFDLARRGYDRRQVDDHLTHLMVQLSEAERARTREEGRANRAESELTDARDRLRAGRDDELTRLDPETLHDAAGAHHGFGLRVEKLLRAAEQEAAETRDGATREATALLEQARADAEAHRHEVEQSLIARNAEVDRKSARRKVELDERERQVSEQSAAAREEADRVLADARQRAEEIEAEARLQAADHLGEVERAIETRRGEADDELVRLRSLRRDVRGDLARVLAVLAGEFERPHGDTGETADEPQPTALGAPVADTSWFAQEDLRAGGVGGDGPERPSPSPKAIYPAAGR